MSVWALLIAVEVNRMTGVWWSARRSRSTALNEGWTVEDKKTETPVVLERKREAKREKLELPEGDSVLLSPFSLPLIMVRSRLNGVPHTEHTENKIWLSDAEWPVPRGRTSPAFYFENIFSCLFVLSYILWSVAFRVLLKVTFILWLPFTSSCQTRAAGDVSLLHSCLFI